MKQISEIRLNTIRKDVTKNQFDDQTYIDRHFKFIFNIGPYRVHLRAHSNNSNIFVQVESEKKDDRCIATFLFEQNLDGLPIYIAADSLVSPEYQGLGIAPRVYEGLINHIPNFSIQGYDQSRGAYKAWQRLASFPSIKIYGVQNVSGKYEGFFPYRNFLNEPINQIDITNKKEYEKSTVVIAVKTNGPMEKLFKKLIKQREIIDSIENLKTDIPKKFSAY